MDKQAFISYEKVRISGLTNMFDIKKVAQLSKIFGLELSKEQILDCMKNFEQYSNEFLDFNTVTNIRADVKGKMADLNLDSDEQIDGSPDSVDEEFPEELG